MKNTMKKNWPELMKASQLGDSTSYKQLLTEITPFIKSYLYKKIFQKEAVEDVAQEVLMAIHKARHTYDPSQEFENWMYGISKFKFIDYVRKHTKKNDLEVFIEGFETFLADDTNKIDNGVSKDIEKALNILSDKQKQIIILTKLKGYSMIEVAKELDMSESAVKTNSHRAFKKMKTWLVEYGY